MPEEPEAERAVFQGLRQGARGCVTRHAIKVFVPTIYPNAKKYWTDMGRIAAQTTKMQQITSPHLVAPDIYEEDNGIGYIQMEMIDGVGLRYLMDGRHVPRARWDHVARSVIFIAHKPGPAAARDLSGS